MKEHNVSFGRHFRWLPGRFDNVSDQAASTGVNAKSMRLVGNSERQPKARAA